MQSGARRREDQTPIARNLRKCIRQVCLQEEKEARIYPWKGLAPTNPQEKMYQVDPWKSFAPANLQEKMYQVDPWKSFAPTNPQEGMHQVDP